MLNLKKGLALVLAAATAFTFAPVANLGVSAEAATQKTIAVSQKGDKIDDLYLQPGETADVYVQNLQSLGAASSIDSVKVATSNKDVAYAYNTTDSKADNVSVSGSTATTSLNKFFTVKGAGVGTATLTVTEINSNDQEPNFIQTITVHVSATAVVLQSNTDKVSANLTRINDANGDKFYTIDPDYTDGTDNAAEATTANAATSKFNLTAKNLEASANYVLEWNTTNDSVAVFDGDPTNHDFAAPVSKIKQMLVKIKVKSTGTATLSFRLYKSSATDKKANLVAQKDVTVEVGNKVDTLSVSYDANHDGKADTTSLSTSSSDFFDSINFETKFPNGYYNYDASGDLTNVESYAAPTSTAATYYNKDRSETYVSYWENSGSKIGYATTRKIKDASPAIYLDTEKNTSIQLTASSSLPRNIIFSSNSNYVAVNQNGLVTINTLNLPKDRLADNYSAVISVTVPQQGTGSSTIAGLTINIPVYLSNEETSDLEIVKANGKTIAKTIGTSNFSSDSSTWGTIYLSTKDKSSETVTIKTGAGTGYVSGAAYAGINAADVNGIDSDIVSYTGSNTSGTVSLKKGAKPGTAYIKVTAHQNGANVNNANVYFRVVVTDKSAAAKVSVPNSVINLTASNKTANIGATVSGSTTNLKYEFVDAIGSTTSKGTSYGDVSVDQKGNVTYTGSNDGVAYILVSGYETTAALAPDEAYVTVNYSSSKAASTLAVTSDKKVNLKVGDTAQIVASGTAITYTSADPSIATVDATGKITAASNGATVITVASPADDTHMAGQEYVTVIVSQEGEITTKPAKVTGVKVSNKKGAYVSVKWASQGKNINYRVWKKVGNGKWVGKNVAGSKTTLSVKKGAKVQVKVKSYVKDPNGKTTWGPAATKAKTFKTDKK